MKIKLILASLLALATGAISLMCQQPAVEGKIEKPRGKPKIRYRLPRVGEAQKLMVTFNSTLWGERINSGALEMASGTFCPVEVRQAVGGFPNLNIRTRPPPRRSSTNGEERPFADRLVRSSDQRELSGVPTNTAVSGRATLLQRFLLNANQLTSRQRI